MSVFNESVKQPINQSHKFRDHFLVSQWLTEVYRKASAARYSAVAASVRVPGRTRRQEVCAYRAKTSAVSATEHNARSFSTADICIASAARYSAGPSLQLAGFTALRETRITQHIFVVNPQGKQPMRNREDDMRIHSGERLGIRAFE
jgi:hypothetical protein